MNLDEVIRGFSLLDNDITKLQRINRHPHQPQEPRPPQAAPHWQALGAFMNMDAHETGIIMEHALGNPSDTTRDALRHLLLVAKLEAGEKIGAHRAHVAMLKADYEKRLAKFNKDHELAATVTEDLAKLVEQRDSVYRGHWSIVVDDFHARCVVADHRMRRMDPGLARAIEVMVRNSKHVNIQDAAGPDPLLVANWPLVYNFKGPHIITILREFKQKNVFELTL